MSLYFTYIWLSIVLHWNSNNQQLSSQYPQILSHGSRQLVALTVGHMVKKRQWFCAKWRVITTLTEQLQWILPWVRWKEICWITMGKLQSNWHLTHSLTHSLTLTHTMEQSPSLEANRLSASQEIPPLYATRSFIAAFTSARHLPHPEPDQSSPCPPVQLPKEQCKYYSPIYVWVFQLLKLSPPSTKIITFSHNISVNASRTVLMVCSMIG
jgi:hypothetical protein